jgi:hypothetical protein
MVTLLCEATQEEGWKVPYGFRDKETISILSRTIWAKSRGKSQIIGGG